MVEQGRVEALVAMAAHEILVQAAASWSIVRLKDTTEIIRPVGKLEDTLASMILQLLDEMQKEKGLH